MKVKEPQIGGICKSRQGRDKDRYYLIKTINPDGTVMLVDGNFKRLASPKKKNVKHLILLPERADSIAEKLIDGRQVFDTEVFSALKTYNISQKENEVENV